jgi:hypothetical protein
MPRETLNLPLISLLRRGVVAGAGQSNRVISALLPSTLSPLAKVGVARISLPRTEKCDRSMCDVLRQTGIESESPLSYSTAIHDSSPSWSPLLIPQPSPISASLTEFPDCRTLGSPPGDVKLNWAHACPFPASRRVMRWGSTSTHSSAYLRHLVCRISSTSVLDVQRPNH